MRGLQRRLRYWVKFCKGLLAAHNAEPLGRDDRQYPLHYSYIGHARSRSLGTYRGSYILYSKRLLAHYHECPRVKICKDIFSQHYSS